MVELKVGQTVRVYVAVWDFCGSIDKILYPKNILFDEIPPQDTITCLDLSGANIFFGLYCSGCTPEKYYSTWGFAYTDAQGIAFIDHIITEEDLAAYQDALTVNRSIQVSAQIQGIPPVGTSYSTKIEYSLPITVLPELTPTHYISLSLGFVPPELMTYFETYISAISDNLMTYIAPPPSPWVYLKTTYDRITNTFNLWFYIPATAVLTMAPGSLQDIYNWFAAWIAVIIGAILTIIGLVLAIFATGALLVLGLIALFAGVAILIWRVIDAVINEQKAITVATNLAIQTEQDNKEDAARKLAEDTWNKSVKTQTDCTTRLQTHRDANLAKINGFLDQYAKYPFLVTELIIIKDSYIKNTNGIITEFKTIPYIATTCDTYFVRLNSEISTSNVAINDALGRNINPAENYSIACKGWTNQAACEKGGCYWYDSSCHQEEACWIANPIGGCILSANTGKTIVGVTAGLILLGVAYWLVTRKGAEVTSIYIGAREAAAAEAARAKAAYKGITAPVTQYPAVSTKIITAPVSFPKPPPTRYPTPHYKLINVQRAGG